MAPLPRMPLSISLTAYCSFVLACMTCLTRAPSVDLRERLRSSENSAQKRWSDASSGGGVGREGRILHACNTSYPDPPVQGAVGPCRLVEVSMYKFAD